MSVDWAKVGEVFGVSLGITIVVVVMFSLGIAAWARAGGGLRSETPRSRHEWAAVAAAAACLAVCLAMAAYGIDLIIQT